MKYLLIDKKQRVKIEENYPYAISRIMEELNKKNISYDFFFNDEIEILLKDNQLRIFVGGTDITNYSHIILRGHYNRRDYEIKRIINKYIQNYNKRNNANIRVQNSQMLNRLDQYSKLFQAQVCFENGINYLDSYYRCDGMYPGNNEKIKTDIKLLKHITGRNDIRRIDGELKVKKNIFLISNESDYKQEHLSNKNLKSYFLQEYVNSREDYRIFLQHDKIIGGWKRKATESHITVLRGNYEMYNNPDSAISDIAIKSAHAFESDFMAVDIMLKNNIPFVLEVNMNPGFKAYETKIIGEHTNIAKAIIESF